MGEGGEGEGERGRMGGGEVHEPDVTDRLNLPDPADSFLARPEAGMLNSISSADRADQMPFVVLFSGPAAPAEKNSTLLG